MVWKPGVGACDVLGGKAGEVVAVDELAELVWELSDGKWLSESGRGLCLDI